MQDNTQRGTFLYHRLNIESDIGILNEEVPDSIMENLNPIFQIRDYQQEAFRRFYTLL